MYYYVLYGNQPLFFHRLNDKVYALLLFSKHLANTPSFTLGEFPAIKQRRFAGLQSGSLQSHTNLSKSF